MLRAYIRWLGAPAGQGVSVLNFDTNSVDGTKFTAIADAIDDALASWMTPIPSSVTAQVVNEMELRDNDTGNLLSTITGTVPAARAGGQASAGFAGGVGARVRWQTSGIRNGRRVIGTTFIVPIAGTHYDNSGTLQPNVVTDLLAGAQALIDGAAAVVADLIVWSKPTAKGAADGLIHTVTGPAVPDQVSWLTSRRH